MDCYKILGIKRGATASEIKSRYRVLSKQYHPDRGGDHTQMAQINEAYRTLADPIKRASHDAALRLKLHAAPTRRPVAKPAPRPAAQTRYDVDTLFNESVPHRKKRNRLRWVFVIGVASTCFVIAGFLTLQNVSVANPKPIEAKTTKPLAITPPENEAISASPAPKVENPPPTVVPDDRQSEPALQQSVDAAQTNDDQCSRTSLGSYTFSHCKTANDPTGCKSSKEDGIRNITCYSRRD